MNGNDEKIPPFIQYYLDKMDYEGYTDFIKLYREYQKQKEDYPGIYAVQAAQLENYNRTTGTKHTLNFDKGMERIEANFRKQAYDLAKKLGYEGADPNQPSDKAFTKQGEKFQSMIDDVKQRQQQAPQPEQKPEDAANHEKKNIETVKEQKPYQQQLPKVEFKTEQPSGTEQPNREELRAAFLEKIKQTRERQQQRSRGKQREI
jgi:hypothetical protein